MEQTKSPIIPLEEDRFSEPSERKDRKDESVLRKEDVCKAVLWSEILSPKWKEI